MQYDEEGRVTTLSMDCKLGGEEGSPVTVALRFASTPGLPAAESAFAAASGTMRFSEVPALLC